MEDATTLRHSLQWLLYLEITNYYLGMSIKEQLHNQTWATSSSYEEVKPFLNDDRYMVANTYHSDGLFDMYYIGLK